MKNSDETKSSMRNIIIKTEYSGMIVGKNSIHKEFEEKQYIPTVIDNLIEEKVENDFQTILKAINLLIDYRSNGLTDFDYELDIILNKINTKDIK